MTLTVDESRLSEIVKAAVEPAVQAAVGPAIDAAIDRRNLASKQDVRDIVNQIIDQRGLATKDDIVKIVAEGINLILPHIDAINTTFEALISRYEDDRLRANKRISNIEYHVGLRKRLDARTLMAENETFKRHLT